MKDQNVRISGETHHAAVTHVRSEGKLLGKFVDDAVKEKLARDEAPTLQRQTKKT